MATFVDQPGLPLIAVDLTCAGGGAPRRALAGALFPRPAPGTAAAGSQLWQIPVCLQSSSGDSALRSAAARSGRKCRFDSCPAWVMGNAGARGYYRAAVAPGDGPHDGREGRACCRPPSAWPCCRTNGRSSAPAGTTSGTFLDLASGFRDERTAERHAARCGTLLATIGEEFTTDATRERAIAPGSANSSRRPSPTSGCPAARPTTTRSEGAARQPWSRLAGGPRATPQVLAKARDRWSCRSSTSRGSVEPTLLARADQSRALSTAMPRSTTAISRRARPRPIPRSTISICTR